MKQNGITPYTPCEKAMARVPHPLSAPTACPYCEGIVEIKHHNKVYGRTYGNWPWMYICKDCGASVGMHPKTAYPLGTLANAKLKRARTGAKNLFNPIWEGKRMSRTDAYSWLAEKMGISSQDCHFGYFTLEQCAQAQKIIQEANFDN